MSLQAITGIPGAGKTLYTLPYVKGLAEQEKPPRQVYYANINGLKTDILPWRDLHAGVDLDPEAESAWEDFKRHEAEQQGKSYKPWFKDGRYPEKALGPHDWWKLPAGSIVVIDECQEVFPLRPSGSNVPEHVARLATHRHRGLDIVLVTQHPTLVDAFVRKLVGKHFHVVRNFGFEKATIHEWSNGMRENPDKSRKDSVRHEWFYDKKVYAWYDSSEKHTYKGKLPAKVLAIPALVMLAIFAGWFAVQTILQVGKKQEPQTAAAQPGQQAARGGQAGQIQPVAADPRQVWLESRQPRLEGLAFSAPIYDEVTRPKQAPAPVACVNSPSKGCRCYSQQGTRLEVQKPMCEQIVRDGFYVPWEEPQRGQGGDGGGDRVQQHQIAQGSPVGPETMGAGIPDPDSTHAKRKLGG